MKILFRTDASYKIGTGHVIRCLTLAESLKKLGAEIEFISRDVAGNLCGFIESKGFKAHKLPATKNVNESYCFHAKWLEAHWEEDMAQTAKLSKGADSIVIDHYAIDAQWEEQMRDYVENIVVIDDLADRDHDCDLLVDQNYYIGGDRRYDELILEAAVKLLGPKYALLRPEFAKARAGLVKRDGEVKNIFIFFGGVDANNDTGNALNQLGDFRGHVNIVAGASNQNYDRLEQMCKGRGNISLYRVAENISALMAKADLAIGAGGSTTWERACVGLPTVAMAIAENQKKIIQDSAKFGILTEATRENLAEKIRLHMRDRDLNLKMSEKAFNLVDGKGADFVASKIYEN